MEEFQLIKPSKDLAPYVKHYWFLKTDDCYNTPQRIIPTGSIDLVFHRGKRLRSLTNDKLHPGAFVGGHSLSYSDLVDTGGVDMISVVFQPYGAKAFFNTPMSEFADERVSAEDMNDVELIDLEKKLFSTKDNLESVRLIEKFLIKRLHQSKEYNYKRMLAVTNAINQGQMNVSDLANVSCLSYKQFKRVFSEYVGANPKDFLRIIRFQKALYILQNEPAIATAQLAYDSGYYDQPHLIKEFKLFSGYTPKEYLSICAPFSDYFSYD
jgi:AraC-like DNA-binding protein